MMSIFLGLIAMHSLKKEPTFNRDGEPSKNTLTIIEKWEPNFSGILYADLFDFLKQCWSQEYGAIYESKDDADDSVICFSTGGWRNNELIEIAMSKNSLFHTLAWESSHRGGLSKYSSKYLIGDTGI